MSLQISVEGISDPGQRSKIENAIRDGVGECPEDEDWRVTAACFDDSCTVLFKTPRQSRTKVFVRNAAELPDAIRVWLKMYPAY